LLLRAPQHMTAGVDRIFHLGCVDPKNIIGQLSGRSYIDCIERDGVEYNQRAIAHRLGKAARSGIAISTKTALASVWMFLLDRCPRLDDNSPAAVPSVCSP